MKKYIKLIRGILIIAIAAVVVTANAQDAERSQVNHWVTAFFQSFNEDLMRGDMDAWMENWAEQAERITPMGNAKGKAQIRQLYISLSQRYEAMVQEITGTIIEGRNASVELNTVGVHRETGIKVSMPNVAVLTFNEQGKVTSAHVYLDMKNIESQLVR